MEYAIKTRYNVFLQDKAKTGAKMDKINFASYKTIYKERNDRAWDFGAAKMEKTHIFKCII